MTTKLTRAELEHWPLPRMEAGAKDHHGQILIIAGSRDVPGAALLAAEGAMRAGAGKLQIATVASVSTALALAMPEAMVIGLREDDDGGFHHASVEQLIDLAAKVDAIVAGPGLSDNISGKKLATELAGLQKPLALDAALLHALSAGSTEPGELPPILLPHAGEMASLLDCAVDDIEADPLAAGRNCAKRYAAITLIKGVESHIVTPEGKAWLFQGGSQGLGISGSGDVLAGIVGGLMARGADPLTALLWGVWVHGEAGSSLGRKIGARGYLARELPLEVPALLYPPPNVMRGA